MGRAVRRGGHGRTGFSQERLGLVGRIIGVVGGLAWAVATFMVVPVLAFEDVGPIEALTWSSSILRQRFGTVARGGLRFGFLFVGLTVGAIAVSVLGLFICTAGLPGHRRTVFVLGVLTVVGIGMYVSAAGMYMRTILLTASPPTSPSPTSGSTCRRPSAPSSRSGSRGARWTHARPHGRT